jgi:competence protein ComGC
MRTEVIKLLESGRNRAKRKALLTAFIYHMLIAAQIVLITLTVIQATIYNSYANMRSFILVEVIMIIMVVALFKLISIAKTQKITRKAKFDLFRKLEIGILICYKLDKSRRHIMSLKDFTDGSIYYRNQIDECYKKTNDTLDMAKSLYTKIQGMCHDGNKVIEKDVKAIDKALDYIEFKVNDIVEFVRLSQNIDKPQTLQGVPPAPSNDKSIIT